MQSMRLIGISGTNGSGKDTIGKLLAEKFGYMFIPATDMLRDELAKRGLPPAREHMRELSAEWRRESGLGVLIDKAISQFETSHKVYAGLAVASLRNPGEADRIHQLGGVLVWVDADPRFRYDRLQASTHSRDAERAVDDRKTFGQFLSEEAEEMHRQPGSDEATLDMSSVKSKADIFLENTYSNMDDLSAAINEKIIKTFS